MKQGETIRQERGGKKRRLSPLCHQRRGQRGFRPSETGVRGLRRCLGEGLCSVLALVTVSTSAEPLMGMVTTGVKGHTSGGRGGRLAYRDGKQVMTSLPFPTHSHTHTAALFVASAVDQCWTLGQASLSALSRTSTDTSLPGIAPQLGGSTQDGRGAHLLPRQPALV